MNMIKTTIAAAALMATPFVASAATVAIDTFDTAQLVITPSGSGFSSSDTAAAPEAVGDNRTITAAGNGTTFPVSTTTINVAGGSAAVSNSNAVTGTGLFEWNAGGVDFTDGGTNSFFVLEVVGVDLGVTFALTVDGATSTSAPATGAGTVTFDFADFGDLTDASVVSLFVTGPTAFDAEFSFIGAAPVPVPAAGLLLLSALGGAAALRRRKKA